MPEPQVAVITGASSGIGATFARKLAARGYDLLLVARREDRLRSLAAELGGQYSVAAEVLAADLTVDGDLELVANRIQTDARLGLLVNNAGFGTHGFFYEAGVAAQDQMYRLHVLATARLCHAALANLAPRNQGGVINVASVAGFMISPGSVSYCSTKSWMIGFTEGLALELGVKGSATTVQALCPGFTLSEFHDVMGMDRSAIGKSLWMTSDFVVEESLRAFDRRELVVVPGWRYKLIVAIARLLPAPLLRRASIRMARMRRRKP
jgi:short-subunit dehydrogenase